MLHFEAGKSIHNTNPKIHQLIFCQSGAIQIAGTLFGDNRLGAGEMMFVPRDCHYNGTAVSDTTLLVHRFDHTSCRAEKCILAYLYSHRPIRTEGFANKLPACSSLLNITEGITNYIGDRKNKPPLWQLKHQEMIWVLTNYYSKDELRAFFHPMTDEQIPFKSLILTHYPNARYTAELAAMCGYGLSTFRRVFKEEFGVSPYQWLTRKRAEQVKYRLSLPYITFTDIIDEFGFSSAQHFNSFCKQYLNDTPGNIRREQLSSIEG